MFTEFFNIRAANRAPVSAKTVKMAVDSALIVEQRQSRAIGAAVLVAPNIALSAAHNFYYDTPDAIKIHRPALDEHVGITGVEFSAVHDLAIVTLDRALEGPFATIGGHDNLPPLTPVFMANFHPSDGRATVSGYARSFRNNNFSYALSKGLFITPEHSSTLTGYGPGMPDRKMLCAGFHMRSNPGNSGAGVFANDELVSINIGGDRLSSFGVIQTEIERVKDKLKL